MLKGLALEKTPIIYREFAENEPRTVFEDSSLLVVNKPAGMLSIPGKTVSDSVYCRIRERYPQATGPLLVHRLDMATSGLLLIAKTAQAHKALQLQFIKRQVKKRYIAVLSKELSELSGEISLPLRVDLDDRPRQLVCFKHGKTALTRWRIISQGEGACRVYFYPHTGRTHQLRLHAAHINGLNAPIVGDELYGSQQHRMLLHAQRLIIKHPITEKKMVFETEPEF
jgi:tRNA pseudouridine32 synthase/23S rRNA pseudouridine746 synthase